MKSSRTKPDNRLAMCADFVRKGTRLADVGTDHAYLPVYLCKSGVCTSAIAADINPEPLRRGRMTIEEAGLSDIIEARLSDGLDQIGADEVDDIVIAGMGGELIARIMDECTFSRCADKHFVLQPMTKSEELIEWLCRNGFEIGAQDCCEAAGKCYTVLSVQYTGLTPQQDELFYYTGKLDPQKPLHCRFLRGHADRLSKKARGDQRFAALAERINAMCDERD